MVHKKAVRVGRTAWKRDRSKCLLLLAGLLGATLLLGLNDGLECGRRLEGQSGGGGNLHFLAGLGVAAGALRAGLHLKGTETDELYLVATLNGIGDGTEYRGKCCLGALLSCALAKLSLNAVYKLSLVHRSL